MLIEQSKAFQQGYQDFLDDIHYNTRYIPMSKEWQDWIEGYHTSRDISWFFLNGD